MVERMMPDETHLMIDLETLGSHNNAVITQIGGCLFQPCKAEWKVKSFCYFIDPQSCIDVGMQMQVDTVLWWMKQSEEARGKFRMPTIPIKEALNTLRQANWQTILGVWAHGITFDVVILENAFKRCGMRAPWNFKAARDTRTLFWAEKPVWPDNPIKHSAEHDAIAQAGAVVSSLRKLGVAKVEE